MFAAVVGVALCAPLTDTDEASLRLVQKTHKLCKCTLLIGVGRFRILGGDKFPAGT